MLDALGLSRFNQDKLKPHLKMAVQRFGILNNKKTNLIKGEKRAIAELLRIGKEEKARIRVEHVIRQDFTIEAYEILELLCELIHERMRLIVAEKHCPPDLKEAVCTLIWAANRTECPELVEVARQLRLKYGKEFAEQAHAHFDSVVNERVVHKLSVRPPTAYLIQQYLLTIAKENNVDWTPTDIGMSEEEMATQTMPPPIGTSVPVAPGSQVTAPYESSTNENHFSEPLVAEATPAMELEAHITQPAQHQPSAPLSPYTTATPASAPPMDPSSKSEVPVRPPPGTNTPPVTSAMPEATIVSYDITTNANENPPSMQPAIPPAPIAPVSSKQPPNGHDDDDDNDDQSGGGGSGGGGLSIPVAPTANVAAADEVLLPQVPSHSHQAPASNLSLEDMQARLQGLNSDPSSTTQPGASDLSGIPPAPGSTSSQTTSDYNDLLSRFNDLKS